MLQNAYFLAKIGADTAENEQHFAEICPGRRVADRGGADVLVGGWSGDICGRTTATSAERCSWPWAGVRGNILPKFCDEFCNFCKFLAGSFSAVSKQNFARKYAFDSIFQALQDLHTFAPLQSQNLSKKAD